MYRRRQSTSLEEDPRPVRFGANDARRSVTRELRARLSEAVAGSDRIGIDRQRAGKVIQRAHSIRRLQPVRTRVDVERWITRIGFDGPVECGLCTFAQPERSASGAEQSLRSSVIGVAVHQRTHNGDRVFRFPTHEQRAGPIVGAVDPVGKPVRHRVGVWAEPISVARVGEHRRELLGSAGVVGRQLQGSGGRSDSSLRVASHGQHPRQLDPHRCVARLALGDASKPIAFLEQLAAAAGSI